MSNGRLRGERFDGAGSVVGMRTGPRNFGAPAAFGGRPRHISLLNPLGVSGGAHPGEQGWQRLDDALVPFPQERGEDVLADSLSPKVVPAIAARMRRRVEIHPVLVTSAGYAVPALCHALTAEAETALQTAQVDAASGVEIDLHFGHVRLLPIQAN